METPIIPILLTLLIVLGVVGGIIAILVYVIANRVEEKKRENFENRDH